MELIGSNVLLDWQRFETMKAYKFEAAVNWGLHWRGLYPPLKFFSLTLALSLSLSPPFSLIYSLSFLFYSFSLSLSRSLVLSIYLSFCVLILFGWEVLFGRERERESEGGEERRY